MDKERILKILETMRGIQCPSCGHRKIPKAMWAVAIVLSIGIKLVIVFGLFSFFF